MDQKPNRITQQYRNRTKIIKVLAEQSAHAILWAERRTAWFQSRSYAQSQKRPLLLIFTFTFYFFVSFPAGFDPVAFLWTCFLSELQEWRWLWRPPNRWRWRRPGDLVSYQLHLVYLSSMRSSRRPSSLAFLVIPPHFAWSLWRNVISNAKLTCR